MSSCSVEGITNSVVSEDKNKSELNVRKLLKTTELERAEATSTPMSILLDVLRRTEPTIDGKKVHLLNVVRDENGVLSVKYKVGSSSSILTSTIENFEMFSTPSRDFTFDKESVERLYSDGEYVNNNDDFEVLALDITNSPEKILEVADALIEADEYHNDEQHNKVLQSQLRSIVKPLVDMVPNMNISINNAGDRNFGQFVVGTNNIELTKGVGGSKSLMEIYVHELYHAVTHFAISSKDTEIHKFTGRIKDVRTNFLSKTSKEDLVRTSGNTLTSEQASDLLDHLSDPIVGLHEFVALSMTNKAVMNQLKSLDITAKKDVSEQKLFYRLLDAVYSLFGRVAQKLRGEPKGDDLQRMVYLVTRLHTANKKPLRAKKRNGITNLISIFNPIERKFVDYVNKEIEKDKKNAGRNKQKEGEGDAKYLARLAARTMFDEQARDNIGNFLSTATFRGGYNLFAPEGTIRTILRDMVEADATQNNVEQLGMVSGVIDQMREFIANNLTNVIRKGFVNSLTEETEISLSTSVLDTDLSSLYFDYDIAKLLETNNNITKQINVINKSLERLVDKESANFYKAQTSLLADYMMTGADNIGLLLNARNIAMKVGTKAEDLNVSEDIVTLVDKLASLKALKAVPLKDKQVLRQLILDDKAGVDALVAYQYGHKERSEKELFPTFSDKLKIIKGYSSEITDPDIDITFAPANKEAELKKQGFKLVKMLSKHELDTNKSAMAMYSNDKSIQQSFHRVGLRITEKAGRGSTVTKSHIMSGDTNVTLRASNDIKTMKKRQEKVIDEMFNGSYDPKTNVSDGMVTPVLNNRGAAKDFRYQMDKKEKIDFLDMERKISVVMGRSYASIADKKETDVYNAKLLKVIEEDAEQNLYNKNEAGIGKNQKEYIKISKNSRNENAKDLWSILPDNLKIKYKDGFVLRRDLMFSYLGYREMSIVDLPGVKQALVINPTTAKSIITYSLQFAEKLWQELIKITKIDILIRTPGVLIGNIVSNVMLAYMTGNSIQDIFKLKYQGVKELKKYVDGLNESIELEAKKDSDVATAKDIRRLNEIKNNLELSPVKDLVDAGFYTTIIEEAEQDRVSGTYFRKLAKRKLKNVPKVFSDGVDLLYITERTKLYKFVEKSIQASDFAARYAQYHLMLEKGVKKDKAVQIVRDNYVNYNKPNSKFVEWANQMGFVMFTKYFTRIQRVIRDYGKNHPSKVLLAVLVQEYLLGDIDDITDQSPLTKDMGNLFYNPFDNMMRVFTPSTIEAVDWAVNGSKGA